MPSTPLPFRAGHALIAIVFALLCLGVVMVGSAGLTIGSGRDTTLTGILLSRPTWLAALAIIAMLCGTRVPIERLTVARGLASPVPWIVLACVGLLLAVHLPGVGREVNGARRWIQLGPVGFQPSEVAKWAVPLVVAWYACRRVGDVRRYLAGFLPPTILLGVVCILVATEDLGTAVLIGAVGIGMLLAAGVRLTHVATLLPPAAAAVGGLMLHSPYRIERVRAFVDPYQDPQGIGYHMLQSMAAVSGGGLAGRGLGNSVQKFGYLPEDTTDFIFAIVCEELGVMGAAVVAALYVALIAFAFAIVRRTRNPFCRLAGLGIALTIGLQTIINLAVVTGSAPTKGIALPLLSSGGTGWLLTAFSLGMLAGIDLRRVDAAGADPAREPVRGAAQPT